MWHLTVLLLKCHRESGRAPQSMGCPVLPMVWLAAQGQPGSAAATSPPPAWPPACHFALQSAAENAKSPRAQQLWGNLYGSRHQPTRSVSQRREAEACGGGYTSRLVAQVLYN